MLTQEHLAFTDRMAAFYAREYGFPPVAGRVLGYLLICEPADQTIAEISSALMASRTAITNAITLLTSYHVVRRTRSAGQRVDHISLDPRALDPTGFAAAAYTQQAGLAREAIDLLRDDDAQRRSILAGAAAFYTFLAERLPALLTEWHAQRDQFRNP